MPILKKADGTFLHVVEINERYNGTEDDVYAIQANGAEMLQTELELDATYLRVGESYPMFTNDYRFTGKIVGIHYTDGSATFLVDDVSETPVYPRQHWGEPMLMLALTQGAEVPAPPTPEEG